MQKYGLQTVVALNAFSSDTPEEITTVQECCKSWGAEVALAEHWALGGAGAEKLAQIVTGLVEKTSYKKGITFLYEDKDSLWTKVETIAREIYGADGIVAEKKIREKFTALESLGFADLPVCIAKTQYSLSADPTLKGRPHHFQIPIRDVKISAGAGFVVVLTGDIMTMPGLPKIPAAEMIDLNENNEIVGLF